MKLNVKDMSVIVGLIISLVFIFDVVKRVDSYYAKAARLELVEMRLEQKILSDRANDLQNRIWALEDRYGTMDKMPLSVREEYRRIRAELAGMRKRLDEK